MQVQTKCPGRWVIVLACAMVCALARPARATLTVGESFNYSVGTSLNGLSGGSNGTASWTAGWTALSGSSISSTNLEYVAGGGAIHVGGDSKSLRITNSSSTSAMSRPFTAQTAGSTIYFSLLFRLETVNAIDNDDFVHFMLNNDTTNDNSAGIGDMDTTANVFSTRVGGSNGGTTANGTGNPGYTKDVTYLLVAKVEDVVAPPTDASGTYDKITLWVNPTSYNEASPGTAWSITQTNTSGTFDAFSFFTVRTLSFDANDFYYMDELRIGTTFADVVPEPATVSLFVLCGPALLMRRRPRVTSRP